MTYPVNYSWQWKFILQQTPCKKKNQSKSKSKSKSKAYRSHDVWCLKILSRCWMWMSGIWHIWLWLWLWPSLIFCVFPLWLSGFFLWFVSSFVWISLTQVNFLLDSVLVLTNWLDFCSQQEQVSQLGSCNAADCKVKWPVPPHQHQHQHQHQTLALF